MTRAARNPVVVCLAAALLFGASIPANKALLGDAAPQTLAGLLYVGAALAVAPWALRGLGAFRRLGAANVRRLVGSAVIGGGVAPVLLLVALARAPSASVSIWASFEATLTAVLAWLFFHESLGPRTWAAVALTFGGYALLAGPSDLDVGTAALLLGACLCWAVDNNLTSLIDGVTPSQTTLVKGVFAGTANLVLGLLNDASAPTAQAAASALGVGALAYGMSIVLYISAAQRLGAARSQLVFASYPFLGVALSWTALGEPVLAAQLGAIGVVAAAMFLMTTDRHEHEHAHEPLRHTHAHRHDDGHHDHVHEDLPASTWHTHPHDHGPIVHSHPHHPDLHHRHPH
jgi:drug/metabolite transporter (DMT)-like permease